jgi:hypothetical protein
VRRTIICLAPLLWSCASPARACFTPADQTAGWKQVALPPGARSLAAPPDIDQYRTGEAALAWQERGARPARRGGSGSAEFVLDFAGERADSVEVTFTALLGGAAIEAEGKSASGTYSVLPRTRSHASTVRLDIADPATSAVVLTVHHHQRAVPRLVSWRIGRWQAPSGPPSLLVYRQPGDRSLQLCEAPGQRLTFHPAWRTGAPRPVTLAQASLLTRMVRRVWR